MRSHLPYRDPALLLNPALLTLRQAVHQRRTSGLLHWRWRKHLQQLSPPPLRGNGLARYTIAPGTMLRRFSGGLSASLECDTRA